MMLPEHDNCLPPVHTVHFTHMLFERVHISFNFLPILPATASAMSGSAALYMCAVAAGL